MAAFGGSRGSARRRPGRAALRCALALAAALVGASAASCEGGRFPVCKSNEECAARGAGSGGKVCYNLKCVACRYDTDCDPGNVCTSTNECAKISAPGGDADEPDASVAWEPAPKDECAARCKEKDKDCIRKCDQRSRK